MAGATPQETLELLTARLAAGDLSAMLELYTKDAVFRPDPTTVATGAEAVRSGLEGFIALRPTLTFSDERVLTSGDVALITHRWQLRGTLPDGTPVEQQGRTINVLRREGDGCWRLAIDDPWDAVPTTE